MVVKEPVKFNGNITTKQDSINDLSYMKKELERIVSENNLFKFKEQDFGTSNDGSLMCIQIHRSDNELVSPLTSVKFEAFSNCCMKDSNGKKTYIYPKKLELTMNINSKDEMDEYKYIKELAKTIMGTQFDENTYDSIYNEAKKPKIMHGIENINSVVKEINGWKYIIKFSQKHYSMNIEKTFQVK